MRKKYRVEQAKNRKGGRNRRQYTPSAAFVAPEKTNTEKVKVIIPDIITVKDFSEKTKIPAAEIITILMKNGILANINDSIDFETAAIIGDDLGVEAAKEETDDSIGETEATETIKQDNKNLELRPPIVTIMGHVDHGKTTLIDKIRESHLVAGESGGITQHISAYQVTLDKVKRKDIKNRTITFIDTPGHAAFSALRSHGAAITDIVVLIVAANDGVKPQTIEVIEQAKKNNVPMIVAINKIDLPNADVMKTKQQLSEYELIPEEWGGKTIMAEISAEKGTGVDELLELILLQADLMELKADPKEKAVGVVIESHMHQGTGALAIVLILNGTLKKGDCVQIGSTWGKVRILEDFKGQEIKEASPSTPTRVAGIKSLPEFGDRLLSFDCEKDAREAAVMVERKNVITHISTAKHIEQEEGDKAEKKETYQLNVIIKADVVGSLLAMKKMFSEIIHPEAKIAIVSEGIGSINESDITLASATDALVLGFRVKQMAAARKFAEMEKVTVKTYDVIYELVDFVKIRMSDMLPPEVIEEELGSGEVLAIFRDDKKGVVVGSRLDNGAVNKGDKVKILQSDNEKWRGEVVSLRRGKDETTSISAGQEFGLGLAQFANVAVGDKFVAFKVIEKKRSVE